MWADDFRLHAPGNTVVEARLQNGQVTQLLVTPESRRKDVRLMKPKGHQ